MAADTTGDDMADGPKITLVGAGGMSFGPAMVNDVVHTPALRGSHLVLHDVDEARLDRAYAFAVKLNAAAGAPVVIDRSTDPGAALDGARFVLSSAEFRRFPSWRQDYEIPNRHGARQITGENGGPGAVFHSLRSIKNTLSICESIEKYSPDAFLINLSNPMSRVTLAIGRATRVHHVGMCHEMPLGINRLARRIGVKARDIEASASGINHFTFFTEMRDRRTGEDLLPKVKAHFAKPFYDYSPRTLKLAKQLDRTLVGAGLCEFSYSPLVVHMVREYGLVPCSVDSHIGEYVPFALDVADWHPVPLDFHEPVSEKAERAAAWAATTKVPLPLGAMGHSSEEVIPIVAAMWTGTPARIMAVNVPNRGYLPDVAEGAIVEVGATIDADGVHPESMPALGEPLAGWIATQVELQDRIVDAALTRDPQLAFEAFRDDPVAPPDAASARAAFDELMSLQADLLPF